MYLRNNFFTDRVPTPHDTIYAGVSVLYVPNKKVAEDTSNL